MSIPDKYIEHKIGTNIDWTNPLYIKLANYIRIVGRWKLRPNKSCVTPSIKNITEIFSFNPNPAINEKYKFYCKNPKDLNKYGPHSSWPLYKKEDTNKHFPIENSGHFLIITDPLETNNRSLLIDNNDDYSEFQKKTNPRGMKMQDYLKGNYLFENFDEVWKKLLNVYQEHPEWFNITDIKISSKSSKKTKKTKKAKKITMKAPKNITWKDCENETIKKKMKEFLNSTPIIHMGQKNTQYIQRCKELRTKKKIEKNDDDTSLYPLYEDPQFNKKIQIKKEFSNTIYPEKTDEDIRNIDKKQMELCKPKIFELASHQQFVKNFLSFQTPYNSLLLFHGLGTGKTCSAISVCEEQRDYMMQMNVNNPIIIVANKKVQESFKLQLFDESKLTRIKGNWTIPGCVGNKFIKEINPMNSVLFKNLDIEKSKKILVRQIKKIINKYYVFMGYTEFANKIGKLVDKYKLYDNENDTEKDRNIKIKAIEKEFSNRMIVIDEVHNIRIIYDENGKNMKKTSNNFLNLVTYTLNMKLLLLTGTPMFNDAKEIIWILNLMNANDNRYQIHENEIFNKGEISEKGKELLIQKSTGYISFVQGEDPFLFPFRLYPNDVKDKNSYQYRKKNKEKYFQVDPTNKKIESGIKHLDLYVNEINNSYQEERYLSLIKIIQKTNAGLNYIISGGPLQILNFAYPDKNMTNPTTLKQFDKSYGQMGFKNCFLDFKSNTYKNLKYKPSILKQYGPLFSSEPFENGISPLENFGMKIKNITDIVTKSEGISIIYSNYISGGCIPVALALEELGYSRYNENNLFENNYSKKIKNENRIGSGKNYILLTGDVSLSKNFKKNYVDCRKKENMNGDLIKVIIISEAASEGLDFKYVRQVHILEPWYNLFRISQIEGRGIRTLSHCGLPFQKRNCMIYLHSTLTLSDKDTETIDSYIYRNAEIKAIEIGKISRILKKNAIDCKLNSGQQKLTQQNISDVLKKKVFDIQASNGIIINNFKNIGIRNNSLLCDYQDCNYACNPDFKLEFKDTSTYNYSFIMLNIDKIIQKIKILFKEKYVYTKKELLMRIKQNSNYSNEQIMKAFQILIEDSNEFLEDIMGNSGKLVNIDNLYLFHPINLDLNLISTYQRTTPIPYKRKKLQFKYDNEIIVEKNWDTLKYELQDMWRSIKKGNISKLIKKMINKPDKKDVSNLEIIAFESFIDKLSLQDKLLLLSKKYHEDNIIKNYFDKTKMWDDDTLIDVFWIPNFLKDSMQPYILEEHEEIPGKYILNDDVEIDAEAEKATDKKWKFPDWEKQIYGGDKNNIENSLPYIGYMDMTNNKSASISFKLKKLFRGDKTPIKSTTSLNVTNAYNRNKNLIKEILKIYEERKEKKLVKGLDINLITKPKPDILPIYVELILRYLNSIENGDNKVKWFFNSTESVIYQINNFPKNLQNPEGKIEMPSWFK